MATPKAAAKSARKTVADAPQRTTEKAPAKIASKAASARNSPQTVAPAAKPAPKASAKPAAASDPANIRVRMYRVGFGDFFLLTVPGKNGPAHILIDCGVHAANIGSIDKCVKDMMRETSNHLALVILTHYHADHMSGFASNYDDFAQFEVGAVWITNRLDPTNDGSSKFLAQLTNVAQQLKMQLGARDDEAPVEAHHKVENALGVSENGEGGSNARALKLLQGGFKNRPPVYYYQGGDTPILPDELVGMITAEILGPSPKDSGGEFAASDNRTEQYLAALGDEGVPDATRVQPFHDRKWSTSAADYPAKTFDEF